MSVNIIFRKRLSHLSVRFQAQYGTRSMVAVAAKLDGEVTFYESYLENNLWKENLIQFQMEKTQ